MKIFNIFKKNKVIDFETYLEKEHPETYKIVRNQLKGRNYLTAYEGLFKAVEYYIVILKQQGEISTLSDIDFLEKNN